LAHCRISGKFVISEIDKNICDGRTEKGKEKLIPVKLHWISSISTVVIGTSGVTSVGLKKSVWEMGQFQLLAFFERAQQWTNA